MAGVATIGSLAPAPRSYDIDRGHQWEFAMAQPVSVRLDEAVRIMLEQAARVRGVSLSSYLRELAADAAKHLRREVGGGSMIPSRR